MTVLYNHGSFLCYPCNPYEGAEVCPPLPNGTCWQTPPNEGPFPLTASANGGTTVRIEVSCGHFTVRHSAIHYTIWGSQSTSESFGCCRQDCDIFSNSMWSECRRLLAVFFQPVEPRNLKRLFPSLPAQTPQTM